MRFPSHWGLVSALLAALLGLRCGAGREVVVGAVLSLSGEGGDYGRVIRQAMDLAVDRVNAENGIGGNPLRILYRDSGSSPEEAEKTARELYDRYDVPLIFGGVLSSETLRIAPLAEGRRKILVSPASSSPEITRAGPHVFRVYPSDALEGAYMAQLASEDLHLRRVTVLAIDNDFGHGLVDVFRKSYRGDVPPAVITYPPRGADFPAVVEKAREAGGEGIYLVGYTKDMGEILKEIRRKAIPGRILGTSSFGSPGALEEAGEAAEGVVYPATVFDPESSDPAVARFVKDFRARYRSDPDLYAAHGYDAVMVAAAAMRKAQGPVPERIAEELLAIQDFHGASGVLSFDPEGDVVQYPRAYIVHSGKFMLFRDYLEENRRNKGAAKSPRP
jgi:branched-chain amino acid transport system substrate-binding protein